MPRKIYPEGTIRTSKSGAKFIKVNGKWEYLKIPKDQWKPQPRQISDEKREEIRRLVKEGKSYDYISKTLKCNKSTIVKYCKDLKKDLRRDLRVEYSPVKIPKNMRATKYPGYYITEEGDAYREPLSKGERMPINEYGLVYLKPGLRGHAKYPEKQYHAVNITLRDENGKFLKQIKECNHRLVAETFIPNPEGYTEVLHGDRGHRCNHYTNLRWGTHKENMKEVGLPEGSIKIHNRNTTHPDGCKRNPTKYIKKGGEWVLIPSNRPPWNKLPDGSIRTRKVNGKPGTFIKENGKWVYQTDNPKPRKKKS